MSIKPFVLSLACAGALAACGDTLGEQALVGGAVGAGTAAAVNGNVVGGAAVGAGANILYCQENPSKC